MAAREHLSPAQFGFAGGVSTYQETPWVQRGQHITLVPQDWAKMPVEHVEAAGMHATQPRLFKKHLNRYRKDPAAEVADNETHPWVVEHEGKHWVVDGHHRVAEAAERGASLDVHIMRPRWGD